MPLDTWIVYIFSEPSRDALVLASRFGTVQEAIARGREYEARFGFYYSIEWIPMDSTGRETVSG